MRHNNTEICKYRLKALIIAVSISLINFVTLQISSQTFWQLFSLRILYAFINLGIMLAFACILYSFTSKLYISEAFFSAIITIYAVINIYVVEFHGTPLTIPEFANTKTALNVLTGYSFIVAKPLILVCGICILSIINFLLIKTQKRIETNIPHKQHTNIFFYLGYKALICLCACTFIFGITHMQKIIKPIREAWHFKEAIGKYGYPIYFLASGLEYTISAPEGYTDENIAALPIKDYLNTDSLSSKTPDIIIILNETFYDISLNSDVETDIDYMGNFYTMNNSISGYAIVPKIGGGTNSSEYELLTANSSQLMQGITPFQTLDMASTSSIVTNLKELGYYTIAMHPADSENYARNKEYPNMGFDEIHFIDDFKETEFYGKRTLLTDKCAYKNMIAWYEQAIQQQKPIFSYLLTIQNHGEWNSNPPSEDIVHVINYNNKTTEERLNEYLSCISISVDGLNYLIEYFKKSERPVILCMVGDHAPSFIEEISDKNNSALLKRATPFIIWANFPINEKKEVMTGMNQLMPLLLETAQVQMLPYFNYITRLSKDIPILTSYGDYIDKDGTVHSYTDDSKFTESIKHYFWLEYNNLQKASLDEWFSLQNTGKQH